MARKAERVAAASRRYQQAIEAHADALRRGDEAAIEKAANEVEAARKRLSALTSSVRPIVGSAGGAALGGAIGAAAGPGVAAIGSAAGAFIGGVFATPKAPATSSSPRATPPVRTGETQVQRRKEIRQLKNKLLR